MTAVMKTIILIAVAIVAITVLVMLPEHHGQFQPAVFDPLNATYTIDNQPVTLVNGRSSVASAPGSATQVNTEIFGEPVRGDLNGDGIPDAAVIIVQDPGGSGSFYYVAAAIDSGNGAQGTNAILLGDRIAPQSVEVANGEITANYADRKPGEPMTARLSVGVSKYMVIDRGGLKEISSPYSQQ